ncbi:excalibur calcium-binding domain-containing protein [Arthrobacter sp. B1805]|uniref:excalibur calcium-binding domain-containing protein n=1 Tax=Arthrobacter sp. B1805 TaxID=2058892 RepID=UPI001C66E47B|nr:excalibur calcium-binding domain-containing protein [Arthrobacter sp. B1805]
MKKSIASITLAAVAGMTMLSASPAMAAPFQNCEQARAAGQVNIPATSPFYNPSSDRDNDGIACEEGDPASVPAAGSPAPAPAPAPGVVTQAPQVVQAPVGGVATGVAQDTDNTAALALGTGFVLAAVAGGTFVVRRRGTQA